MTSSLTLRAKYALILRLVNYKAIFTGARPIDLFASTAKYVYNYIILKVF